MVMNNKIRRSKLLIALAVIASTFVYGIIVGKHQLFPYSQLRLAKALIVGQPVNAHSQLAQTGRQTNYLNRIDIVGAYGATTDVVMIGDSITDYVEWSELFPGVSISNRGLAGDTTDRLLQRMDTVFATGAKSAFIMIGVNEIIDGRGAEDVFANYEIIIEQLLSNGVRPYIQSTIFVGKRLEEYNIEISALNTLLRDLAVKKDIIFIDVNSRLSANGVLDDRFTVDAIHLNGAGYRVWKDLLDPLMDYHLRMAQSRED